MNSYKGYMKLINIQIRGVLGIISHIAKKFGLFFWVLLLLSHQIVVSHSIIYALSIYIKINEL